jgi:prepilin-type processing-associated H-X9-DG protein
MKICIARHGHGRCVFGLTLVEFLAVIAVVALLAVLFLPHILPRSQTAQRINCTNNLKQMGLAFQTWALDHNDLYPMQVSVTNGGTLELASGNDAFVHFAVVSNELATPKLIVCPDEKENPRNPATTFSPVAGQPNIQPLTNDAFVSYFLGVNANETNSRSFLAGDRHLILDGKPATHGLHPLTGNSLLSWQKNKGHDNAGNLLLVDGSVQQLSSSKLNKAWRESGAATNRLVVP